MLRHQRTERQRQLLDNESAAVLLHWNVRRDLQYDELDTLNALSLRCLFAPFASYHHLRTEQEQA